MASPLISAVMASPTWRLTCTPSHPSNSRHGPLPRVPRARCWTRRPTGTSSPKARTSSLTRIGQFSAIYTATSCRRGCLPERGRPPGKSILRYLRGRRIDVFGKLTWAGHPLRPTHPARRRGVRGSLHLRHIDLGVGQGLHPLSLARMDHERRSQAYRHHVLPPWARHAATRLHAMR